MSATTPRPTPSRAACAAIALAAICTGGCATIDQYFPTARSFGVYKIDINQGNYLSQDMVDKLKVGMTKPQVQSILGTPLIASAFRENRWDYTYEYTRQGNIREHRQFTAYFTDGKLVRWEGDEMPQSVVELNRLAAEKALPKLPGENEKSFFDRIKDIFKREP